MIPSILKTPVFLAQQVTTGVVRLGVGGAAAILRRVLPGESSAEDPKPSPRVSTEPVAQQPPPKKPAAKKPAAKKATPKKPASTLDEPAAPVERDAVVYSSGPGSTTTIADDLGI